MNRHENANARTTPLESSLDGLGGAAKRAGPRPEAAASAGVSRRTVRKGLARHGAEGDADWLSRPSDA